eukprot:SAG31_NODE_5670_length_2392_cov_1.739206_1_plen_158_part_00
MSKTSHWLCHHPQEHAACKDEPSAEHLRSSSSDSDEDEDIDRIALLEASTEVQEELDHMWSLMVSESCRLRGVPVLPDSTVTRSGYVAMHMRVSKALDAAFDVEKADHVANADWAEDITAFSGDSSASIWLEEVKKKFKSHASRMVQRSHLFYNSLI